MAIRVELARQDRSRGWLAAAAGLSWLQLSNRLSGRSGWRDDELARVSAALGVAESALTGARREVAGNE